MPNAYSLLRPDPVYRRQAFDAGLAAAGYTVNPGAPRGAPGDVLLIWNRYGRNHDLACEFESRGGRVLVAENGYVAAGGRSPHGTKQRDIYALAWHRHNGAGAWPAGDASRWQALGVALSAPRADGRHVLVCPNRPFGTPGYAMPADWPLKARQRLRELTGREVRVRPHPGNMRDGKPLADDLEGAWCVVIWASSAGVHALIAGIPVICCAPAWVCRGAACSADLAAVERASINEAARLAALSRLAWAQWTVDEITTGVAILALMQEQPHG